MKAMNTAKLSFAALALLSAQAFALTPTDLATLGTKSYESQWDGSLRVYRDLAYSTRNDLSLIHI